jgi:hypothetical protein
LFADKLRSKGQNAMQIKQAANAVSLLFAAESMRKHCMLAAAPENSGQKAIGNSAMYPDDEATERRRSDDWKRLDELRLGVRSTVSITGCNP